MYACDFIAKILVYTPLSFQQRACSRDLPACSIPFLFAHRRLPMAIADVGSLRDKFAVAILFPLMGGNHQGDDEHRHGEGAGLTSEQGREPLA
jgi:hypothetical protein